MKFRNVVSHLKGEISRQSCLSSRVLQALLATPSTLSFLRLPARQNHRRRVSNTAPRAYKPHARDGGTERRGLIVEEAASCRVETLPPPTDTPSSPHPHTHPPSSRFDTPLTRCLKIKNICTGLSQAHTYER